MKKNTITILFVLLNNYFLFAQMRITDYKQNAKEITFALVLQDDLSEKFSNLSQTSHSGFFDESKPGKFAIPSKSLFIAIPFKNKFNFTFKSLSEISHKINIGLNPKVTKQNDSTLSYDWEARSTREDVKPLVILKGFSFVGNYYCVNFDLNPYNYDDVYKILNIVNKIEFKLSFENELSNTSSKEQRKSINSESILNYEFASQFYISNPPILLADSTGSWIKYDRDYVKLGINKDGIYRIYGQDLTTMGVNLLDINPDNLQLINYGKELPIFVSGNSDGRFDLNDYIEFIGSKLPGDKKYREASLTTYYEYSDRYTDTMVYWLTWGPVTGKRADTKLLNKVQGLDSLTFYNEIIHYERNNYFDYAIEDIFKSQLPFYFGNKTWGNGGIYVGNNVYSSFNVTNLVNTQPASVYIKFQDYATSISTNSHKLGFSVNQDPYIYDSTTVNKYEPVVMSGIIPGTLLKDGPNSITLKSFQTASTINICYLDWVELEYPRALFALSDSLNFTVNSIAQSAYQNICSKNFSSDSLIIWKYGAKISKIYSSKIGTNLTFADTISKGDKYYIIDGKKITKPFLFYKKRFINLRDSTIQADYIAITHKKFSWRVSEYLAFISSAYGKKTKLIDVEDIYDQFYYGVFCPESIRDFIKSTIQYWKNPKPAYLFLVGTANYDFYGNKSGPGGAPKKYNYVPSYGSPVSDNYFVILDTITAAVPQMSIGRLPISEISDFDNYFSKHSDYVTQPYSEWNKTFVQFSGGKSDDAGQIETFKVKHDEIARQVINVAPFGGKTYHFYKTVVPRTNFGPVTVEQFDKVISDGAVGISYLGHSGTQTWDNSITDEVQLKNKVNRYPLVTDFGCSTGRFAEADVISFSELFVTGQNGQAIGYLGNSSLGFLSTSTTAPKLFYSRLILDSNNTVGDALRLAKSDLYQQYGVSPANTLFSYTNTLIGDPIVKLKLPRKPNLSIAIKNISISPETVTENTDSVKISFSYNNFGRVILDSVLLEYKDQVGSKVGFSGNTKRLIPLFGDTLSVMIPIAGLVGEHSFTININPDRKIEEIYYDDNIANINYNVASTSIRALVQYKNEYISDSTFMVFNPITFQGNKKFSFELSDTPEFFTSKKISIGSDTLVTKVNLSFLTPLKRYYYRYREEIGNTIGAGSSFYLSGEKGYGLNDSLSFSTGSKTATTYANNILRLDTNIVTLSALSAGFNDGNTVNISRNNVNLIAENTLSGYHVGVFDAKTFEFIEAQKFCTVCNDTSVNNAFKSFLDGIGTDKLVLFAIADDGALFTPQAIKDKIKLFGSKYIDNVGFRNSWVMIGKRNAPKGSVPEKLASAFAGRVYIDTSLIAISAKGSFISSYIGPASAWKSIKIDCTKPGNSVVKISPIGFRLDGVVDTLVELVYDQTGFADISKIDPIKYPRLKLLVQLFAGATGEAPLLKTINVNYSANAELALNYQTVKISADTVKLGNEIGLSFFIANKGEVAANNFKVRVDMVSADNTRERIFETLVDKLQPEANKYFSIKASPSLGDPKKTFSIAVDPDNSVTEVFKDNNYYNIPFMTTADTVKPNIAVYFDGNRVYDGDFVPKKPEIKVELNDPSYNLVSDTSYIKVFLDEKPLTYSSGDLRALYNNRNPKMVVILNPNLAAGEHEIKIFAKDASGGYIDSTASSKRFVVEDEARILNVYNYPNPFKYETYFTFKLTNKPDEIKIRIFTITGRLIKEITPSPAELQYDFNKIYWDGRDADGDIIANGTYIYKLTMKAGDKTQTVTEKLVLMR